MEYEITRPSCSSFKSGKFAGMNSDRSAFPKSGDETELHVVLYGNADSVTLLSAGLQEHRNAIRDMHAEFSIGHYDGVICRKDRKMLLKNLTYRGE